MKQPKRMTRKQKIEISKAGHDPSEYVIVSEEKNGYFLKSKQSGKTIYIEK